MSVGTHVLRNSARNVRVYCNLHSSVMNEIPRVATRTNRTFIFINRLANAYASEVRAHHTHIEAGTHMTHIKHNKYKI